jgi:hypothetical protein
VFLGEIFGVAFGSGESFEGAGLHLEGFKLNIESAFEAFFVQIHKGSCIIINPSGVLFDFAFQLMHYVVQVLGVGFEVAVASVAGEDVADVGRRAEGSPVAGLVAGGRANDKVACVVVAEARGVKVDVAVAAAESERVFG